MFAGGVAALVGILVWAGVAEAQAGRWGTALHPGLGDFALPAGIAVLADLVVVAWARRSRHHLLALIASVCAFICAGFLLLCNGAVARAATTCPAQIRHCGTRLPYPSLVHRTTLAFVLILPTLLGIGLIILNVMDGFNADRLARLAVPPTSDHHPED